MLIPIIMLQESRPLEKVSQVVAGFVDRWNKLSIPTVDVAKAMVRNTLKTPSKPVEILEHPQIVQLAKN